MFVSLVLCQLLDQGLGYFRIIAQLIEICTVMIVHQNDLE